MSLFLQVILVQGPHTVQFDLQWAGAVTLLSWHCLGFLEVKSTVWSFSLSLFLSFPGISLSYVSVTGKYTQLSVCHLHSGELTRPETRMLNHQGYAHFSVSKASLFVQHTPPLASQPFFMFCFTSSHLVIVSPVGLFHHLPFWPPLHS